MCGIGGVLDFSGKFEVSEAYLLRLRDDDGDRGPDVVRGFWISEDRRIGLAHRRLSIIDLAAAASFQLMGSQDGRLRIVFNDEIYNHAELRQQLLSKGHRVWQIDLL